MKLIILASGRGSRLKSLTKDKPKSFIEINGKRIIDRILDNSKYFNETIIVAGYKSKLIKKYYNKYRIINNYEFSKSNMVHSMFKVSKYVNSDVVISYADIIYDFKIIEKLVKIRDTCLPLNALWKKNWEKRMSKKKIYLDAENVVLKGKKVIEIGTDIKKQLPKYQFMGIIKISKKDFFEMKKFYKLLENTSIDLTTFLNEFIKYRELGLKYKVFKNFWFEIDNQKDLLVAKSSKVLRYY